MGIGLTYSSAVQQLKHLLLYFHMLVILPYACKYVHMLVIADLEVNIKKQYAKQRITYRNTKNIDLDKFKQDI